MAIKQRAPDQHGQAQRWGQARLAHVIERRVEGNMGTPADEASWVPLKHRSKTAISVLKFLSMEDYGILADEPGKPIRIRISGSDTKATLLYRDENTRYGLFHRATCKSDNCYHIHVVQIAKGMERLRINGHGDFEYLPEHLAGGYSKQTYRFEGGCRSPHTGIGRYI
jgi:hypothetical protein